MAEFYQTVPRDLEANLAYRVDLRRRCAKDIGFRRAMLTACKHDILFWLSAFCYVYEPRPRLRNGILLPKTMPMIPWDHQIPVIIEIKKNLGFRDIGARKARGEGFSWMLDFFALHDWLFKQQAKVGLVSSSETKSDDPGNMDSLLAKIDWELTKLPDWMTGKKDVDWERNKSKHSFVNFRTDGQINAFAATDDVARGGRFDWFGFDELGSWKRPDDRKALESCRSATESRLVVSTPNGAEGAYYDFMHTPSNMREVVLNWVDNPTRNRGLYRFENGKPRPIDPVNNPLPADYWPPSKEVLDKFNRLRTKGFVLEARVRSPWYDNECDRADSTPQSIAQELDMDFGGSMYRIFKEDFFAKTEESDSVKPAITRGIFDYHPDTLKPYFGVAVDGPCFLWAPLDAKGRPAKHQYVVAADVATGLGGSYTSNSVAQVVDLVTGEQVFEFASNTIQPDDFADYCVALAQWYHGAYLAWEINGPGSGFTTQVKLRGYGNCYMRTCLWKNRKTKSKELGWHTNQKSTEVMFMDFIRAVRMGDLKLHSKNLVTECGQYVRLGPQGVITHIGSARSEDDSSRGQAHGDRVMAMAVAWQAIKDRPLAREDSPENLAANPPQGCLAYRDKAYQESLVNEGEVWDDRTNWDLASGGNVLGIRIEI